MQLYKYKKNTQLNKEQYQKIYVDNIPTKLRQQTLAHQLFDIIDTLSQDPPPGCVPLNRLLDNSV